EDRDEILGILLAKDLLRGVVSKKGHPHIRELLRPAVLIPESKKLNVLLREFRQSRNHMAIVIRSEERRVGKKVLSQEDTNRSEDGIRAFHVTGVQTCALPI